MEHDVNRMPLMQLLNSALLNLNRMAGTEGLDKLAFAVKAGNDIMAAINEAGSVLTKTVDMQERLRALECHSNPEG